MSANADIGKNKENSRNARNSRIAMMRQTLLVDFIVGFLLFIGVVKREGRGDKSLPGPIICH